MTTYTLWIGTRSPTREEYGLVEVEGEEVFAITFDDGDPPVDYRVFEAPDGRLIIYYIERRGDEKVGGIDVYESLADFLLKELPAD
jgi:hypothetical protein